MSRIGKLPINIPNGVSVDIKGQEVIVKGPKGEEKLVAHSTIRVISKDDKIICERNSDEPEVKAFHGLTRSLINNCVVGVSSGFEIILDEAQGGTFRGKSFC